jgi:hypothetical protein
MLTERAGGHPLAPQGTPQLAGRLDLVFDDQDAHVTAMRARPERSARVVLGSRCASIRRRSPR